MPIKITIDVVFLLLSDLKPGACFEKNGHFFMVVDAGASSSASVRVLDLMYFKLKDCPADMCCQEIFGELILRPCLLTQYVPDVPGPPGPVCAPAPSYEPEPPVQLNEEPLVVPRNKEKGSEPSGHSPSDDMTF